LSPHKLFRRAFLEEHGIRFPEGRRRLEDHVFVTHAYFHARRISVLADYPCYHWMVRRRDNASLRPFDPAGYYGNLREVLDVVDEHTEPGPFRDRLYAHWYRDKMLRRVGAPGFAVWDADYRRQVYEEVRRLALERCDERLDALLPFNMRLRARLLRRHGLEALEALADVERRLRPQARLRELRREGGEVVLRIEAELRVADAPLLFERRGGRVLWVPPPALAEALAESELEVGREAPSSSAWALLRASADLSEHQLPGQSRLRLEPAGGGALRALLDAEARLDPETAAGGAPLRAGDWEVLAALEVAGFRGDARVLRRVGDERLFLRARRRGGVVEDRRWRRRLRRRLLRRR
ncbi:MAG: hypothetical protein IRZ21_07210, partial [Thermoleophilaceae bacterium]|nr:hypothetical protein [Thermoleophilaceae bacterium]